MIKLRFLQALLVVMIGSAMFLMGCKDDDSSVPEVKAGFTYTVDEATGGIVTFVNTSENADEFEWDFDDGTFSTLETPAKTYLEDGEYDVTLTATNAGGSDTFTEKINIALVDDMVDEEAPVITLTGDAVVDVELGGTYDDAGATANDNVDGDLTSDIVVGGDQVNTDVSGTYTITYDVSDAAGNAATQVTRAVRVRYPSGLITNGDFEAGEEGWSGNALQVRTEGTNSFNFADVATAGDAFAVNLSHVVEITQGESYILSFDASTSTGTRTMIAGIGLNQDPWTNTTKEITLTDQTQRFTLNFSASNFGGANSRIIFDMGAAVGIVVIDNVKLELDDTVRPTIPVDFESDDITYGFGDFDGGVVTRIDNPDKSGINDSDKVAQMVKNAGQPWGGSSMILEGPIDFSTKKLFKMKVWVPKADVKVLLKVENSGDPAVNFEKEVTTTTTNAWEELTFDFSNINSANQYNKFVWIFENGTMGDGSSNFTYYFDDIILEEGAGGSTGGCSGELIAAKTLPLDFEGCETFLGRASTGEDPNGIFGAGIAVSLAENPSKDGVNGSDNVLKIDKGVGADFYAGLQNVFENNFDLTTTNIFKFKIYSTKANVPFRFELLANPNDGSIGNPAPVFKTIETANTWTEVEVEFTNLPAAPTAYRQLVIKPDNDANDSPITVAGTYYIDDIRLEEGSNNNNGGSVSEFCNTEVKHLGIDAETASAINLTVENVDAQSMKVSITSANDKAVDVLIVNNLTGPITGSPAVSAVDDSVAGTLSVTLTWTGTPPSEVELNVLWSKAEFDGNWQLGSENAKVSFSQSCN